MAKVNAINYFSDYQEIRPSLFRESENLDSLIYSISEVQNKQQEKFLWLSENILNVYLAEKSHLDFIGNIVGQPRLLLDFDSDTYFGFYGSYHGDTFGSKIAPEIGGVWKSRSNFDLPKSKLLNDEEYRRLIKAKVIYNKSDCNTNDLLEVVNLITNHSNSSIQLMGHGELVLKAKDPTGLLSYFIDRAETTSEILPIPAGVRIRLEQTFDDIAELGLFKITNPLFQLVNEDLPEVFGNGVYTFNRPLESLTNTDLKTALKDLKWQKYHYKTFLKMQD